MLSQADYFNKLLRPLGEVTVSMERHGVPFDAPSAQELLKRIVADETETRAKLDEWVVAIDYLGPEMPPNWGSWQQLQLVLYTPLGLDLPPALFWKKGRTGWEETDDGEYIQEKDWDGNECGEYKTDDVALKWLGDKHPEHRLGIDLIRELRWIQRARNYVETWLGLAIFRDGWWWLHPSFGLASDRDERAGARTGRFAVKNPALQQVPTHGDNYGLRRLFRAPPGYKWVIIDYSQLEVVVLAHICHRLFRSTGLIERMEPGKPDTHSLTAKYVFGEVLGDEAVNRIPVELFKKDAYGGKVRDIVKAVRYGLNYGKGARGFGDTLFLADGSSLGEERAQKVIDGLLAFDPEIAEYQKWVRWFIEKHEGMVSLLGRWTPLPDSNAGKRGLRNRAWRQALNYPMQAGGQEVTAAAMIAIYSDAVLRKLGACQMLQVHDELCMLVPECNAGAAKERMMTLMLNTMLLDAPLGGSGGIFDSWGEAKA